MATKMMLNRLANPSAILISEILAGKTLRESFMPGSSAGARDVLRDAYSCLPESFHRQVATARWNDAAVSSRPAEPSDWLVGYRVFWSPRGENHPRADVLQAATNESLQSVRYEPGKLTTQQIGDQGPFAVFECRADAESFEQSYGTHVYSVLYLPSPEDELWKKRPPKFVKGQYGGYYAESAGITERSVEECPPGTATARAVWLMRDLHRVYESDRIIAANAAEYEPGDD